MKNQVRIIGGGLAGSEAAWQAAEQGLTVHLYEMRPAVQTGAHASDRLAELVCSNSLGSKLPDRASGVLMAEMRRMGSMLLEVADQAAVPAGGALAVDREGFAGAVTDRLESHPRINIHREEVVSIPEGLTIVASGPLTSNSLASSIEELTGQDYLYFFDALAPIVEFESINMEIAFFGSRYGRGEQERGDYINCPLDRREYEAFIDALLSAERIPLRSFEDAIKAGVRAGAHTFFEGCLPIEIIAERGRDALAYGPMRPVGLTDPRTGKRPHAVVQLRQDDIEASLFNIVGFQTNLSYAEQRQVLRMIPGLEQAHFFRYGQMHRNTFINSPTQLLPTLQHRRREDLLFAGQITGVEGYLGNIATGLLAGLNAARQDEGRAPLNTPGTTMLGALCDYISHADPDHFQPMKANFGIMPALEDGVRRNKRQRAAAYAERAHMDLEKFLKNLE
ncbi:MAG: methylenetetrahydrofolate--tRNA-(uracil(54)-C(5))-methyltransferase (FADH(2)-oxidizing) TrmFO [Anaerolineales bacterium]|nr:methylenetetrahydrofolate--tRNA-(uracil(54)-C(5))-methyltransferase (FADH(2)-oxidizing) TrmFO [Anaerolineales bacterium]